MIELTGFKQSDDSRCGVAAVKTILYYYGIDKTEDEIAKKCNHTYELGCTNTDMSDALIHYGIGSKIISKSSIDDLEYWTRHKIPVIVDIFIGNLETTATGHAVVVIGVDKKYVHVFDPYSGKTLSIQRNDFNAMWFDWENTEFIQSNTDMIIRLMIVPYPSRLA